MPTFTFNLFKIYKHHFYKVFDVNATQTKISLGILFAIYLYCVFFPVPSNYTELLKQGGKLQSIDYLFDYTVPLLAAIIIFYAFLPDYKNKIHLLFNFFVGGNYNRMIFFRWIKYVGIFSIGTVISHMMYFRNVAFLNIESVWLALAKLPNILILCAIVLFFMHQFKSGYIGLFVMLAYYIFDFISAGRTLAYLSLGAHSNNFYYEYSPKFYIINRFTLVLVSILLLLLTCKKHSNLNMNKWFKI